MNLNDDILDSRDLEERIVELKKDNNLTDQEKEELEQLTAIKKDVEDYSSDDWEDGITFVSQYYWQDYCKDFAYDCGYIEDIDRVNANPLIYCIDRKSTLWTPVTQWSRMPSSAWKKKKKTKQKQKKIKKNKKKITKH